MSSLFFHFYLGMIKSEQLKALTCHRREKICLTFLCVYSFLLHVSTGGFIRILSEWVHLFLLLQALLNVSKLQNFLFLENNGNKDVESKLCFFDFCQGIWDALLKRNFSQRIRFSSSFCLVSAILIFIY